MTEPQCVLVTGGAGFIGSHLAARGLAQGCRVWIYDNFSRGRREFLPASANLAIVEGDILDGARLKATVCDARPHVVFHLAAIHHIPTCEEEPASALRTNVEGTQQVLSACAAAAVPRIVFASTGAIYGVAPGALAEDAPLCPHEIYGISKLTGEHLVRYYAERQEKEAVIARLFNTVGRHETNAHVIPDIVAQLVGGGRRIRVGNLDRRRDYVHVEDVAEALFRLSQASLPQRVEVCNIGSGREHSVEDIIRLFAAIVGAPLEAESVAERRRRNDRPNQMADLARLRQLTGWGPARTLRQALDEVWTEWSTGGSRNAGDR